MCANSFQNELGEVFKHYPPGYVTINGNVSLISQMCTTETTILRKIKSYSINLHTRDNHSGQKDIPVNSPSFPGIT